MLAPQNRHCQPIIADSLLPKNRKKQQAAEISMEPPVEGGRVRPQRNVKPVAQTKWLPTPAAPSPTLTGALEVTGYLK